MPMYTVRRDQAVWEREQFCFNVPARIVRRGDSAIREYVHQAIESRPPDAISVLDSVEGLSSEIDFYPT